MAYNIQLNNENDGVNTYKGVEKIALQQENSTELAYFNARYKLEVETPTADNHPIEIVSAQNKYVCYGTGASMLFSAPYYQEPYEWTLKVTRNNNTLKEAEDFRAIAFKDGDHFYLLVYIEGREITGDIKIEVGLKIV